MVYFNSSYPLGNYIHEVYHSQKLQPKALSRAVENVISAKYK